MKILVVGYGAMGKKLAEAIKEDDFFELIGVVSPMQEEKFVFSSFELVTEAPDVIIDFSHYSMLEDILDYAKSVKASLLIATTGHSEYQLNLLDEYKDYIALIKTANTSLGINVMNKVLKEMTLALHNFDIEVIEKHHNKKLDSPSGTANLLLNTITDTLDDNYELKYGRYGNEKRDEKEIGVSVIRGGSIVGEHSVLYCGNDEVIEIKHEAFSKNLFVNGALYAAKFLGTRQNGLYTMEDVLFSKGVKVNE